MIMAWAKAASTYTEGLAHDSRLAAAVMASDGVQAIIQDMGLRSPKGCNEPSVDRGYRT